MAKKASRDLNVSIGGTAIEDDLNSASLAVEQEVIDVTGFADAGPRAVVGNYNFRHELGGFADFASGQSDATLFALVTDTDGAAMAFDPTGATAGANDPNYDSTIYLSNYTLSFAQGAAATFTATLPGGSALTRAVA